MRLQHLSKHASASHSSSRVVVQARGPRLYRRRARAVDPVTRATSIQQAQPQQLLVLVLEILVALDGGQERFGLTNAWQSSVCPVVL